MFYKKIKLTDCFPMLCRGPVEKLAAERKAYAVEHGISDFSWSVYREPTLTAYVPDNSPEIDSERLRASILICPGGGYEMVSDREAEPVALEFLSRGYNVFVLDYEVAPAVYPAALLQASASMALIRRRAKQFHADPEKIAVCGFSAGGHLAGSLGVFWDEPFIRKTLEISGGDNRPNAMILCYAVLSSGAFAHRPSFESLLGKNPDEELIARMSLENQVSEKVPPAFLWHTFEDDVVPCENSLNFAKALRKQGIPFELHVYPKGEHGMSLCTSQVNGDRHENLHAGTWVELCDQWMKQLFSI